jgi:hypothetical protein
MRTTSTVRLPRRLKVGLCAAAATAVVGAGAAYAALPPQLPPGSAPAGFFVSGSRITQMELEAIAHAVEPDGSRLFVQHSVFAPGQSTGWHTHPGPAIVMVVSGTQTLKEAKGSQCVSVTAGPGEGFVTTGIHEAVTGPSGADTWALYVLPPDATTVRDPETGSLPTPAPCQ